MVRRLTVFFILALFLASSASAFPRKILIEDFTSQG